MRIIVEGLVEYYKTYTFFKTVTFNFPYITYSLVPRDADKEMIFLIVYDILSGIYTLDIENTKVTSCSYHSMLEAIVDYLEGNLEDHVESWNEIIASFPFDEDEKEEKEDESKPNVDVKIEHGDENGES